MHKLCNNQSNTEICQVQIENFNMSKNDYTL